ncbi:dTMP kinase [Alloscardovia omnicolens]|uniref:dTMP kinase n=1 Tax=Alloscardovia omnicolens TaxID=419015 RepID=UPI003A6CDE58
MSQGLFISFEGVDGVGKSTQVRKLHNYLEDKGVRTQITFEPGGTDLGQDIRRILLHGGEVSSRAEALLYAADRAQHVDTYIRPALERGEVVITDRYIDSSVAYQSGGRELSETDILDLSEFATHGLWPDRTYVLDMSFAQSRQRLTGQPDRLESAGEEFFERTRQAFLDLARREPERCVVVDASLSIDEVWQTIRADIDALLARYQSEGRA